MTSQRWSTLVSVSVFTLVLATAGSGRAQWGFPVTSGYPSVSPFGHQYGTGIALGTTPYNYGSFGGLSYSGFGGIGAVPPSFGLSNAPRPQAAVSFQSVSNVVTLVPGWSGWRTGFTADTQPNPAFPRGAAAVIPVEYGVENIKPIGTTRWKDYRGTVDRVERGHHRRAGH